MEKIKTVKLTTAIYKFRRKRNSDRIPNNLHLPRRLWRWWRR